MSFLGCASLITAANTESGYLATVTLAPTASGAEAFDLGEKRAECFQACYKTYGNYKSCTRGSIVQCWCNESDDWVEREEDCVWDICGPSAYNGKFTSYGKGDEMVDVLLVYADVLRRICETVTASASQAVETGSSSSDEKITSSSAEITSRTYVETTSQAQATEITTSQNDTMTTTSEPAGAATTAKLNSGPEIGSSLGVPVVLVVGAVYLAMIF
ncbi:hypothetical protein IL306_002680 [Fusarium sp. DS 682]|nr:hypothetical protein IL306_002680 [Fusarium sp. DS 682]